MKKIIYTCKECGSDDVEVRGDIYINNTVIVSGIEYFLVGTEYIRGHNMDGWCACCEGDVELIANESDKEPKTCGARKSTVNNKSKEELLLI